ncbi:OmpA family protein [Maritimibacter sp. DP1N21-5]|uniref:OmpA family protein n=1 Tax=Maritimibacter sp. DP1N21-5 TaxID=2836867 RepID=UPI001C46608E|nr:OmpA family protein [Maritimibacter sp. DP1N21-5]MBV7408393.1 OmpA family protein [Maritimibacter sp. DP1N21-5]
MTLRHLIALALLAAPPAAADVRLPDGAVLRSETVEQSGTYALPIGAHNGDSLPVVRAAGTIMRQAWRIGGTGQSSYQLLVTLRQQLIDDGYDILFECDQKSCGGFDFRFDTDVIREPEMHVDLGDYQFVSAHMPGDSGEYASLLVSRSASAGFVQVIRVSRNDLRPGTTVAASMGQAAAPEEPQTQVAPGTAPPADVGAAMEQVGRFVLSDLRFETGSSALGDGRYDSLASLAGYLKANATKRVALVGHTDAEGSLAANIAVSKRRATSVLERLVTDYGVPASQLEAEGMGYLAPLASNQTEEGRTLNRRVEAILVSTE